MKLMKQTLALMLSLVMVFTLNVFAYTDVTESVNAIETLSALNILTGFEDDTFRPDAKITRAQMAAIICRALGYEFGETASVGNTPFTDVPVGHWATAYIEMAESTGIINGYGNGLFGPEDEVTYDQVVKMIVCALGYQKKAEAMVREGQNPFPTAYNAIANQKGITDGVAKTAGGASRATVAELVYNALTVNLMDQTSFGTDIEFKEVPNQSLLYTKLKAVLMDAKIVDVDLDNTNNSVMFDDIKLDDVAAANYPGILGLVDTSKFTTIKRNGINVSELQGLNVTALVDISKADDYKLLAIFPKEEVKALTVDATLFEKVENNRIYYYKSNSYTVNSTSKVKDLVVYRNLEPVVDNIIDIDVANGDTTLRFVDNNNDGYYDTLFIDNYKSFIVGRVYDYDYEIVAKTSGSIYHTPADDYNIVLDPEDETVSWTMVDEKGNALEIDDVDAGDVITYAKSEIDGNTYYNIVVGKSTSITGTVEEYYYRENSNDVGTYYYTINGKKYVLNTFESEDSHALNAGDYGTFTLTADGKIIAFDLDKTVKNFGILIATDDTDNAFENKVEAMILDAKGRIKVYEFADKYFNDEAPYDEANFPNGALIEYELKADGTIKSIKFDATYSDYDIVTRTGNYSASSNKIGSLYFTDESVIVNVKGDTKDKTNYTLISEMAFVDTDEYTVKAVINEDKEVILMLVNDLETEPAYNSIPLYITGLATVAVDGEARTKVEGYVGDDEVAYVLAEDYTIIDMYEGMPANTIAEGDVIQLVLNGSDEITAYRHLVKVSGNATYVIAAADLNAADEGAVETSAKVYKYENGTVEAVADTDGTYEGFGAIGRVQRVNNKTVGIFTNEAIATENYELYVDVAGSLELPLYVATDGRHLVKSLSSIRTYKSQGNNINKTDDIIYIFKYDDITVLQYAIDTLGDNK